MVHVFRALTLVVAVPAVLALVAIFSLATSGSTASAAPTCSNVLPIANHGQHILGDYVTGVGHVSQDWPPNDGVVGQAVAGSGAALPGGPGAGEGGHFDGGVKPGASFCTEARSPAFDPRGGP